jgi:hypothetical protein
MFALIVVVVRVGELAEGIFVSACFRGVDTDGSNAKTSVQIADRDSFLAFGWVNCLDVLDAVRRRA